MACERVSRIRRVIPSILVQMYAVLWDKLRNLVFFDRRWHFFNFRASHQAFTKGEKSRFFLRYRTGAWACHVDRVNTDFMPSNFGALAPIARFAGSASLALEESVTSAEIKPVYFPESNTLPLDNSLWTFRR